VPAASDAREATPALAASWRNRRRVVPITP
jgi:hypothetical protein